MKTFFLTLTFIVISLITFSQVITIKVSEFDKYFIDIDRLREDKINKILYIL